jgi:hypothetical protein
VKALALARAIALATLFGLCVRMTPAQTQRQVDEMNPLTEKDRMDTLDYGEWPLNAQFWFEHPIHNTPSSSLPTSTSVPLMKLHSARSCATSTSDTIS